MIVAMQCLTCGTQVRSVRKDLVADIALLPDFDPVLQERHHAVISEKIRHKSDQKRADFFVWYDNYLRSATWLAIREKVLQRCRGRCEGCGHGRARQVHHLTYAHVGDEFLFELVGVCEDCHERLHKTERT